MKRRYSDRERAEALAALAANAGDAARTARQLGVPYRTLKNWQAGLRHPEAAVMGNEKKRDMADALEAVAWKLLDALPDKVGEAPLNQAAVALGIAIDKARLLREQPTAISKSDVNAKHQFSPIDPGAMRLFAADLKAAGLLAGVPADGGGEPVDTPEATPPPAAVPPA